jgi:hypothetical protein
MVDVKPTVEANPMNIATISAGFEKGDFLVREEQGNRVYFDFFEEVRRSRHRLNHQRVSTHSRTFLASKCSFYLTLLCLSFRFNVIIGIQLHLQQGLFANVPRR